MQYLKKYDMINRFKKKCRCENEKSNILFGEGCSNILKAIYETHPKIESEIYLLTVSSNELLYERMKLQAWYQEAIDRNEQLFPRL